MLLLCVYSEKSEKERKGNNNVSKTSAFCVNLVSVSSVSSFLPSSSFPLLLLLFFFPFHVLEAIQYPHNTSTQTNTKLTTPRFSLLHLRPSFSLLYHPSFPPFLLLRHI